jgi:hypothetical protein
MTPNDLADKIERQLKLHEGLDTDFRLVLTPDAGRAFVDLLRKTDDMISEILRLREFQVIVESDAVSDRAGPTRF